MSNIQVADRKTQDAEIVSSAEDTFSAMIGAQNENEDVRLKSIEALIETAGHLGPLGDRARKFLSDRYNASFYLSLALAIICESRLFTVAAPMLLNHV